MPVSTSAGPAPDESIFTGTPRFRLTDRLGVGASGVVYAALDLEKGARVALKVLARRDPGSLARFKREFREMQDLHHPNLVERGELFADGEHWFFTMELVDGVDFLTYVRGDGARQPVAPILRRGAYESTVVDEEQPASAPAGVAGGEALGSGFVDRRLRATLPQLVEALVALHGAGLVHRDVKPSNVLVTDRGRLVLLDGGLVMAWRGDAATRTRPAIAGTVTFMAPEQAEGVEVAAPADFYSLGVILYWALNGRAPFEGDFASILAAKRAGIGDGAAGFSPRAPVDLVELCLALLSSDPGRRPTGSDILRVIGRGSVAAATPVAPVAFVGRQEELARLGAIVGTTARGGPTIAVIVGESGIGKTALMRQFLESLAGRWPEPHTPIWTRCYEREVLPYKAFEALMEEVSDSLRRLDCEARARLMPNNDDAALLRLAFPQLDAVPGTSTGSRERHGPPIEPHERRRRLFEATRALLLGLARHRPLVLAIDDLHWADTDSLALLVEILRPPRSPSLLVLATARPTDPPLPLPAGSVTVALDNLPPGDAHRLADALIARAVAGKAEGMAAAIVAESGGHPLFIQEMARLLAKPGVSGYLTLETALGARVRELDQPTRRVLEVLSLAVTPLCAAVAAQAADVDPAEWDRHTALLRGERFARMVTGGALFVEPYHDRVRQAVLAMMPAERKRELHRRLAETLSSTPISLPD